MEVSVTVIQLFLIISPIPVIYNMLFHSVIPIPKPYYKNFIKLCLFQAAIHALV